MPDIDISMFDKPISIENSKERMSKVISDAKKNMSDTNIHLNELKTIFEVDDLEHLGFLGVTFKKAINIIQGTIFLYEYISSFDNFVIRGKSLTDLKDLFVKEELLHKDFRNITRYNLSASYYKDIGITNRTDFRLDKIRAITQRISDCLFYTLDNFYRVVRESYMSNNLTNKYSDNIKYKLSFDVDYSALSLENDERIIISKTKKTDAHTLLTILFKDHLSTNKEWNCDELWEAFGNDIIDYKGDDDQWRKFYYAAYKINVILKNRGFEEFIHASKTSLFINKNYLK